MKPNRTRLFLAYLAFMMLGLTSGLLAVAWPSMRAEFGLSLSAMGQLLLFVTTGNILANVFNVRLINRFGIGVLLSYASLVSALAIVGYSLAPSWLAMLGVGALAGFSGGVMSAGLNTFLAAEYRESEMQWMHAAFSLGATLSLLLMTASLALSGSWRPGYWVVGLCMALIAAALWLTRRSWRAPGKPAGDPTGAPGSPGLMDYRTTLRESLLQRQIWAAILLFLLYTGAEFTFSNWTYTLLIEGRGISPAIAGVWAAGFWATFTCGRVLGALYAHRIRLDALLTGAMLLALAGALLVWVNSLPVVGVIGVFLVGFALSPIFPGLVSSTRQRVGERHAANAIGIQMAAANLGIILLPALAGVLAQRISLEIIPVMLAVSLVGLLVVYRFSTRLQPAEYPAAPALQDI